MITDLRALFAKIRSAARRIKPSTRRALEAELRAARHALVVLQGVAEAEHRRVEEVTATNLLQREQLIEVLKSKAEERERFLRGAYHDIMQPLAAIAAFSLAAKNQLSRGHYGALAEALEEIDRSGQDIEKLLRGIYELFTFGTQEPVLEPVAISRMIQDSAARFADRAQQKHLEFRVRVSVSADVHVLSDRTLLKRVLDNLVSNAIKYTHHGGVLIGYVAFPRSIRLDIWDTGEGIPEAAKARIFDEFYQVGNPRRSRASGLGLGLAIVRTLIERLPGHRLSFASRLGRGSRFSLDIPTVPAPTPQAVPRIDPDADHSLAGRYIVLVDDDSRILKALDALLTAAGCITRPASSLAELRAIFEQAPDRAPNLVLTDFRLNANESGRDVLDLVAACYDWAMVPVLIYTAELALPETIAARDLVFHVNKGAGTPALLTAIRAAIAAGQTAEGSLLEAEIMPKT